jgi:membrane protease YdiL (CAAX protease family)
MKRCDYCGRQNEDSSPVCSECGSAFHAHHRPRSNVKRNLKANQSSKALNAWSATLVFFSALAVQMLFVALYILTAHHFVGSNGKSRNNRVELELIFTTFEKISTSAVVILTSAAIMGGGLKDSSPNGAAWVRGRWQWISRSIALGVVIAAFLTFIGRFFKWHGSSVPFLTTTRLAGIHILQVVVLATGIVLVPATQELLFRGVLYAGYRNSFGALLASILTTLTFISIHLPTSLANIVGLSCLSAAALWSRLHWKAIGPAIGVHSGYNLAVAIIKFLG